MDLQAKLILPPEFDDTIAYPVLVKVYGGPGSQAVFRRFGAVADFDTYVYSLDSVASLLRFTNEFHEALKVLCSE